MPTCNGYREKDSGRLVKWATEDRDQHTGSDHRVSLQAQFSREQSRELDK